MTTNQIKRQIAQLNRILAIREQVDEIETNISLLNERLLSRTYGASSATMAADLINKARNKYR